MHARVDSSYAIRTKREQAAWGQNRKSSKRAASPLSVMGPLMSSAPRLSRRRAHASSRRIFAGETTGDYHEMDHGRRCGLRLTGRNRERGCSRHRLRAGGQSIKPPRSQESLKPPGSVGARRQQSAGFGPSASGCDDFSSHVTVAHDHDAIHGKDQIKAEGSPAAFRCTALKARFPARC